MTFVAVAFSALICAFGVVGLLSPARTVEVARRFATRGGLYFAGALRLCMGVSLVVAAPASRAPRVVEVLGTAICVAGVATLFIGVERARGLVDWWSSKSPRVVRAQAVFALVLGLLLAYALVPF